ncbi:hypothetical protein [Pseudoduganella namucuonensis]|uniref:Flagellar protein FlgJ n=1 Tax=Pseudoduganella namucuonensis TaxID=1035707 RepID=A0A1I7HUM3_9BURK|nr:hypothetical protein [Pseudoduganella namucuonensis]SFU64438.1 flagellar protein FlgJ [Pseudoduganella namucuonensis]
MDRFAPIPQRQLALGKQEDKLAPVAGNAGGAEAPADTDPASAAYRAKAAEAAVKFESFFIGKMLNQMRSANRQLAGDGEDGHRDSINDDMLDMADNLVADQLAGRHAFGVADAILRQLLPTAAPAAPPALPGGGMPLPSSTKSRSSI